MAARLRSSSRAAFRHGPGDAPAGGATSAPPASVTTAIRSLDPELVDQHVELLAELVVADPLGDEVDELRGEDRHDRRLGHDGLVDGAPLLVGAGAVGLAE